MTEKMEMVKLGFFSGGIELRLCEGMKLWFSIGRKKIKIKTKGEAIIKME